MRRYTLALLASLLLSLPLAAETYTYTGNPFSYVANFSVPPVFTTSDYVTITFTTAAPLPDNLGFVIVDPLSWSFSDVAQSDNSTYTNARTNFHITTNASGQIVDWDITDEFDGMEVPGCSCGVSDLIESSGGPGGDVDDAEDLEGDYATTGFQALEPPGPWSATPTPEAPPFVLLMLGGACLCGAGCLRTRKRHGSLTV